MVAHMKTNFDKLSGGYDQETDPYKSNDVHIKQKEHGGEISEEIHEISDRLDGLQNQLDELFSKISPILLLEEVKHENESQSRPTAHDRTEGERAASQVERWLHEHSRKIQEMQRMVSLVIGHIRL